LDAVACFDCGFDLQVSPLSGGQRRPSNTMCHLTPNPSNGLSRVHKCDRRQTDRPRYGEMCRSGEISCVARAIPHNNSNDQKRKKSTNFPPLRLTT